ncbi:uncharacterized protein LOC132305327 [Cornus florida]|uniref:uncharacterized protein LOC132305327 n=1 Tax=Cornus florida TaxID=4283 RepID=UPI00289A4776|nr:uncharacterized protein LOC132305327 [Cornus florida]
MTAFSRFISRLSDKCKSFFGAIKSNNKDIWGPQQQMALNQLKRYMDGPPILSAPQPSKTLIMYLAISGIATRVVTRKYQPKEDRMKAYKKAVESATLSANRHPGRNNYESSARDDGDPREPCWMDLLEAYLKQGTLLDQKAEARKVRFAIAKYSIINNQLYKKLFSGLYLKCLSPSETFTMLKQVHDGDCGNHSSGRSLTYKILTQGYFWPYLARNAEEYARRCDKCQRHGPMKHQPAENLHTMASPWPFA